MVGYIREGKEENARRESKREGEGDAAGRQLREKGEERGDR